MENVKVTGRCAWRPREWGICIGIGRSKVFELIKSGEVDSVKAGSARLITTPPEVYVASLTDK